MVAAATIVVGHVLRISIICQSILCRVGQLLPGLCSTIPKCVYSVASLDALSS